jgi:hypothetical protein
MSKSTVFVVALAAALLSEPARQKDSAAAPRPPYKAVKRLSENTRQSVFSELLACRADASRQAGQGALGAAPDERGSATSLRQRARQASELAGAANACADAALDKHRLQRIELGQIEIEGTCKQWRPLRGKPTC